jgi:uncharacterized membrane protein
MPGTSPRAIRARLSSAVGWLAVGLVAVYAAFAVAMAVTEISALLGATPQAKPRAVPPLFVLHTLTGAVALTAGALQVRLGRPGSIRRVRIHRLLGRCYVAGALITSVAGLATAAFFDVGPIGKAVFAVWATLWVTTTTVALQRIRAGRVTDHRRWMIRSFALALVFAAFDPVRQALESAGLPRTVVYALGLATSMTLTLATAETWIRIRSTRPITAQPAAAETRKARPQVDRQRRERPCGAAGTGDDPPPVRSQRSRR